MTYAYLNGEMVERAKLSVSLDDYGFSRGNVVFELTRVYGSKPFKLGAHLSRLMNSLKVCHIQQPYSVDDFRKMTLELVEKNNLPQSVVKVYVTQGTPKSPAWSLEVGDGYHPNVFVIQDEFKPFSQEFPAHERYYKQGIAIATVELERTQPEAKTTNYVNAIVGSSKVASNGFEDILYINKQGYVTECSRSNIFFVKDGVLITPKADVLPGVTRQTVLELAKECNILVQEREIAKNEIDQMDEAFMTGSTVELMPVCRVDDAQFPVQNFTVYKTLWHAFKKLISE